MPQLTPGEATILRSHGVDVPADGYIPSSSSSSSSSSDELFDDGDAVEFVGGEGHVADRLVELFVTLPREALARGHHLVRLAVEFGPVLDVALEEGGHIGDDAPTPYPPRDHPHHLGEEVDLDGGVVNHNLENATLVYVLRTFSRAHEGLARCMYIYAECGHL